MLAQIKTQTQAHVHFEEYFALQDRIKEKKNEIKALEALQEPHKKALIGLAKCNQNHFVCGSYQIKEINIPEKTIKAYSYFSISGG